MALFVVQLFFPYLYYFSSDRKPNSEFQVGIHYVYEQDTGSTIYTEAWQKKKVDY
jgi:hypothetical protein